MASVATDCIAPLIDFFLLRDSEFSFTRVCTDTLYRKRLAFLGDAVLKPYVVKYLIARQGLLWSKLGRQTEHIVSNAYLSVVFEKLDLQKSIDSYVQASGTNSVHDKATYVEAMLGLTEMLAPKKSCTVVANIISLLNAASKPPTADQKEEAISKSRAKTRFFSLETATSAKIREMHQHWVKAAKKQKLSTVVKQQNDGIHSIHAAVLPDSEHVVPMQQQLPSNVSTKNVDSFIRAQDAPYIVAVRRRAPMSLCGGVKKTVKENIHLFFLSP